MIEKVVTNMIEDYTYQICYNFIVYVSSTYFEFQPSLTHWDLNFYLSQIYTINAGWSREPKLERQNGLLSECQNDPPRSGLIPGLVPHDCLGDA